MPKYFGSTYENIPSTLKLSVNPLFENWAQFRVKFHAQDATLKHRARWKNWIIARKTTLPYLFRIVISENMDQFYTKTISAQGHNHTNLVSDAKFQTVKLWPTCPLNELFISPTWVSGAGLRRDPGLLPCSNDDWRLTPMLRGTAIGWKLSTWSCFRDWRQQLRSEQSCDRAKRLWRVNCLRVCMTNYGEKCDLAVCICVGVVNAHIALASFEIKIKQK